MGVEGAIFFDRFSSFSKENSMEALLTLRELRQKHFPNHALHQLVYALARGEIAPRRRAGMVRLFGEDQVPEIRRALNSTSRRTVTLHHQARA
jgi:hypothetical protein